MSWTRVGAILPGVMAGIFASCAKVEQDAAQPALPEQPTVTAVDPSPGTAAGDARFTVTFSAAMDEGLLLASSGRSETVVLAAEANVERAAAAIAHSRVTVEERALFVPASAQLAADTKSIVLAPDATLVAGTYYLLVSPRLKDTDGRKLQGNGARFQYAVTAAQPKPRLLAPVAGALTPLNLSRVLVHGEAGQVAVVDAQGAVVGGPVAASGDVAVAVAALQSGASYHLSVDGAAVEGSAFTASACPRAAPVAIEGGAAQLMVGENAVDAAFTLDAPAEVDVAVCAGADCRDSRVVVACAPSPCDQPAFVCAASVRIEGLQAATAYAMRIGARDLQGFEAHTDPQPFQTAASLPRLLLSEVMAAPPGPTPRSDGEYVELFNMGPGAARIDTLALIGEDGVVRPLVASPPPQPVILQPGARALAVGASFDPSRYPTLPATTPVLRASTQRLLGSGLRDDPAPAMRLVVPSAVPVELASFPGGVHCPDGASLQRDETLPPDAQAGWRCGPSGGTPGLPP